jgi:membrane-bound inhibitor of C-type lysozyme
MSIRFGTLCFILIAIAAPANAKSTNSQSTYRYQCAEKQSFTAIYSSKEAIVKFRDGKTLRMRQVPAASGVRYQSAGYILWTKGDNAFLDLSDRQIYKACVTRPVSNS